MLVVALTNMVQKYEELLSKAKDSWTTFEGH